MILQSLNEPSHLARAKFCQFVFRWALFFGLCGFAISPSAAYSLSSNWVGDPNIGEVRLTSAVAATGDLQELPLGLEFRLAPGWKIYWRTPGEAGLPPEINLIAEGNLLVSSIEWPIPKRFNAFGFDNFGYDTDVILPLQVTGHKPNTTVQLHGQVEALVCADICVPIGGTVALTIPAGIALATAESRSIARASALVPWREGPPLFAVERAWQVKDALHMRFSHAYAIDDIFIEGIEGVSFKKPDLDGTDVVIEIEAPMSVDLVGNNITATIIASGLFAEQSLTIKATAPDTAARQP